MNTTKCPVCLSEGCHVKDDIIYTNCRYCKAVAEVDITVKRYKSGTLNDASKVHIPNPQKKGYALFLALLGIGFISSFILLVFFLGDYDSSYETLSLTKILIQ